MLYQHSFWYRASQMAFEDVLKADPECGIAYWGIALSLLWNPHVPAPAKNLAEGAAAIAKGKSDGAKRSEEHTSELQSLAYLVCRLLLEKKNENQGRRRGCGAGKRPRLPGRVRPQPCGREG